MLKVEFMKVSERKDEMEWEPIKLLRAVVGHHVQARTRPFNNVTALYTHVQHSPAIPP